MKKHIPNALTCLNLLCGCLALTFVFTPGLHNLVVGAYFVGLAAVADFLDGLVARALRVSSPIGKDLDSLADMVSFGVVPGAILYMLLNTALASAAPLVGGLQYLPLAAFILTIFSALRLAKFNNDTRQTNSFIGLPTPACTLVVASLPLILAAYSGAPTAIDKLILNPWALLALTVVLSGLLVAELPLFALKFKSFGLVGNRQRYLFLLLAGALTLWLHAAAVPLVVLLYVGLSVVGPRRA
ncbi:CDP-alcohol phosphatidyltransferase family protein [Hymenobacter sp. PAMC 26628]|uniref:CDP-alcohol phosphatidyltransferase family protein n=1 Tax=Hymenobacter sp. PAMC 26628 TaxID=1484118 RepID=UPI0007706346|nr:CDP-alcohol phosphatidyltransferase family protein [Hymenobacter sp. PAMC 26628]AMJ64523.1 CDP-diacylglycerol--serine O-phosphatidyltransferase [Hymenobacter sp. PAMC 26628]